MDLSGRTGPRDGRKRGLNFAQWFIGGENGASLRTHSGCGNMSGRLTLLQHKSWNVWNADNRARVERDKREDAERKKAAADRERSAVQELTLGILLRGDGDSVSDLDRKTASNLVAPSYKPKDNKDSQGFALLTDVDKSALNTSWWVGNPSSGGRGLREAGPDPDPLGAEKRRRDDLKKEKEDPMIAIMMDESLGSGSGGETFAARESERKKRKSTLEQTRNKKKEKEKEKRKERKKKKEKKEKKEKKKEKKEKKDRKESF